MDSIQTALPRNTVYRLAYNLSVTILAITASIFLASLPVDGMVDRVNYLVYASASDVIWERYASNGIAAIIFNEPLWLLTNVGLSRFMEPEQVLLSVIFFSTFFTFYLTLKNNKKFFIFAIVILLLPQILKNNIIHLRQGLAVAIFLMGWFSGKHMTRLFFILLACFIHSSFLFIFLFYFLYVLLEKLHMGFDIKILAFLLVGLALGVGGIWLAGLLGARQGEEYANDQSGISGLGFIFWALILSVLLSAGKEFIRKNIFEIAIVLLYLTTYFFLPVTGRVLESALIPVCLSATRLPFQRRLVFYVVFLLYFLAQWYIKISVPGLGWFVI